MSDHTLDQLSINTIRTLSIDAVQQAKSGVVAAIDIDGTEWVVPNLLGPAASTVSPSCGPRRTPERFEVFVSEPEPARPGRQPPAGHGLGLLGYARSAPPPIRGNRRPSGRRHTADEGWAC
jgi:hypothetical protein